MNNTVNKPNTHAIHLRACLLSVIPKRNAEHVNVSDVLESMNRFHSENKKLEISCKVIPSRYSLITRLSPCQTGSVGQSPLRSHSIGS